MARTDILLPTCNRLASLVMTLGGVAAQTTRDMRIIIADQSDHPVADDPVVQTLVRVIEERGGAVEWHHRPRLHGIAEQRDFLLRRATADLIATTAELTRPIGEAGDRELRSLLTKLLS